LLLRVMREPPPQQILPLSARDVTIVQLKLRADIFLRARSAGVAGSEVVFSVGPEHGEHVIPVSDAAAHVLMLMLMLQLMPRPV
jgi:hypothetical protein